MKCPSCQTYVTKIPINWKCPHCNEKLPDPSRWYLFYEYWVNYFQDKGSIFWSLWFGIFLLLVAAFEVLLTGDATLFTYISHDLLISIFGIFYTGMLIEMFMLINLPLRMQGSSDFLINERKVIRNIRKATNLTALLGIGFAFVWLGPSNYFENFVGYSLVLSWFMAMCWAIVGLFLDVKMVEDVRFRVYMDRLGITSLKRLRRIGTGTIGSLVVVAILYHVLLARKGLWFALENTAFIGSVILFFKQYLGWLF